MDWNILTIWVITADVTFAHLVETVFIRFFFYKARGFPSGLDGKESVSNSGDLGSVPGLGRSPGEGNVNTLQYSCLENAMDRGAWGITVHGVTELDMNNTFTRYCKTTLFFFISMLYSLEESHHVQTVFKEWKIMFHPLKGRKPRSVICMGNISSLPSFFIYSIIYWYQMESWIILCYDYNIILQYFINFVAQIVPALAIKSSIPLAPIFLWHMTITLEFFDFYFCESDGCSYAKKLT